MTPHRPNRHLVRPSWVFSFAVAVLTTAATTLVGLGLTPLIGGITVPVTIFCPAVMVSALYGGSQSATLSILLSTTAAAYFFYEPIRSLRISNPTDQITLLIFVIVGIGIALLSESQRQSAGHADEEARLRRNAELAERAQRQRLETTLAAIGDGVIAVDALGNVSFMNLVAEALTGWDRKTASGRPLETVFHVIDEDSRTPAENLSHRAMDTKSVVRLVKNTVLIATDGRETPIDAGGSAMRDAQGNTTGAVLTFRDITERRRIERDKNESTRAMRQLAAIVESADDAILGKDLDLRITSWNRAAERMFGYMQDEAIGQSVRLIIPQDRWTEEDGVMRRIQRDEKVEHLETKRRHNSGFEIPVLLTISPIHDATGAVVGASTIVHDLTEIKRAEAERRARHVAEEANRAKDEFLAMLSHELSSPLSVILGWVRILKEDPLPPDRVSHTLDVIERQTLKEARLVESLLDLSRIAADKLDIDKELIDLRRLVGDVVHSMRPMAHAKGMTLDMALVEEPLTVIGDSFRLQQVFSNLLTNAIKFTPRDGCVQIRVDRSDSHAQVQIVDNGSGIEAEVLPYVFDRFQQADSARGRAHGGLGLGLTIVRELVHAHSGTVVAESRGKGHGCTFTVTLPIPAVIPEHIKLAAAHVAGREEPTIAGLRILVVDDDHDACELVAVALGSRGAITRLASSSAEALDLLRHEKPDLMIADIGMPQEDGYVLVQTLRAAEREQSQPHLPAIALTAHSSPGDRDQALAAGFNLHLAKPVAPYDLACAVRKVSQVRESID